MPDRSGKKKKEKNTNYEKIAKAIGDMQSKGIKVSLVDINKSSYTFRPDAKNNKILYGLKPLSRINEEIISAIVKGRPYNGIKDFMQRCPLQKVVMVNLIKAGAFDNIDRDFNTRQEIMAYYLMNVCEMKKRLTLQNFNGLIQHDLVPKELELEVRIFNFNKYIKNRKFILDQVSIDFLNKFLPDVKLLNNNEQLMIDNINWKIIYDSYMNNVRTWIKENYDNLLYSLNLLLFKEIWDKYAKGNLSSWEMDSVCFYYHKHELNEVNTNKYGIIDFNEKSTEPEVDYYFKRNGHQIPIYKLSKIIGTVIAKNDTRHTVTLLTTTGVVSVKFTGEYYSMFKKQISKTNPDGTKTILEKGWFTRGNKLMVQGFRRDDQWVSKNYKNSGGHQLYKIAKVIGEDIIIQSERISAQGSFEEEEYGEY